MPPSTVFSYWRRDHRRSTAPASLLAPTLAPKGAAESPINTPPQLPEIPDTPTLTSPFEDGPPSLDAPPWIDSPVEQDASKLSYNTTSIPLSSSASLAAPSPLAERDSRPHSSPEEHNPELVFTSQPNTSQLSVSGLRPDQGDGDLNSKPTSPFRLSFGKGLRNLQAPSNDLQKRSPTAGSGQSHFRLRSSPEDSPADRVNLSQRDFKTDGGIVRRAGDRDVSMEHTHHKSGKAMLHLLNPMSLLARRRSSQMSNSRTDEVKISAPSLIPAIPDDYDPRIRGSIVHDFSAPRPRRIVSGNTTALPDPSTYNAQEPQLYTSSQSAANRWNDQTKRYSDHSPVFKEHFEDDQHALQVENKGYLQSTLLTNPTQHGYGNSVPAFARKLPASLPSQSTEAVEPAVTLPTDLLVELPGDTPSTESTNKMPSTSPATEFPLDQQGQDTIPYVSHQSSGLPRHLKSNASRFSFDMGGVESSAQEKLLEEKHKAKEAQRKLEDGYFDDFDDEFDHDLLDDGDGLEEKIPGVNVDADEDDFLVSELSHNMNGVKSWAVPGLSPVVASPIIPAPLEPPNKVIGSGSVPIADEADMTLQQEQSLLRDEAIVAEQHAHAHLPLAIDTDSSQAHRQTHGMHAQSLPVLDDEDDLYFDDGEFGDLSIDDQDGGFDESVFDDETSHLYQRKSVSKQPAAQPSHDTVSDGDALEQEVMLEEATSQGLKHMPSIASEYRVMPAPVKRGPLGEPIPNMGPARAHGGVLTEQNLEVLHNALAFAANEAAGQGRFERTFSTSNRSHTQESISQASNTGDSQPGLVSDDSRLSQAAETWGFDDVFDDHIYDDNDDTFYDDAIVAAANAEALENDDEGFYGQEFGFYAQAHGTCSSELTNGGYFGPRGVEGITRSHSSRGKFQEPSLTPITERSEWSTRNSVISLKAHGATHSNPSLASPGLAQLVDMGNLDDEMTLSALMKLRRGAWGGSNGSLRSSAGSPPPHTLPSSNRGSFTGVSEASPDTRPSADEGLAGIGYMYPADEGIHGYTASPLQSNLGSAGDLPLSGMDGPSCADDEDEVPTTGTYPQDGNVL